MPKATREERKAKRRELLKRFFKGLWSWVLNFLKLCIKPKFILCFGIAWMLVNGIWYVGLVYGIAHNIPILITVCGAYVALLYFPITAEKFISVPIAAWLAIKIFPRDKKLYDLVMSLLPQRKKRKKKGCEDNGQKSSLCENKDGQPTLPIE